MRSQYHPILLTAWLGAFLAGFDFAALYVAIPVIANEFNIGLSATSWVVLIYTLVFVGFTIPVGTLGTRYGIKRMMIAGFVIFGALSVVCALSTNIQMLAAARTLQALGGSILYVLGPAILRSMIPHDKQDRAFGLFAFAPYVGISLGPGLGGLITFYLGWNWIFLVNVPVCLVGLLALRSMPAPSDQQSGAPDKPLDIGGSLLGFVFLACLVFAFNQGREWGWGSPVIVVCLVASVAVFVAFIWWEMRSDNSAIDLSLFGRRVFGLSLLTIFLILFVSAGAQFLFPIHAEWLLGLSVHHAGFLLMAMPAGLAISSLQSDRFSKHFHIRDLCMTGLFIAAIGIAIYAFGGQLLPVWIYAVALAVFGFGIGMHYPHMMRLAMQSTPLEKSVETSTAMSSLRSVSQLLGIVVFETLFSEVYLKPENPDYGSSTSAQSIELMNSAFMIAFTIGIVICLFAIVLLLFLSRSENEQIPS